jgi:hypothetical protein
VLSVFGSRPLPDDRQTLLRRVDFKMQSEGLLRLAPTRPGCLPPLLLYETRPSSTVPRAIAFVGQDQDGYPTPSSLVRVELFEDQAYWRLAEMSVEEFLERKRPIKLRPDLVVFVSTLGRA